MPKISSTVALNSRTSLHPRPRLFGSGDTLPLPDSAPRGLKVRATEAIPSFYVFFSIEVGAPEPRNLYRYLHRAPLCNPATVPKTDLPDRLCLRCRGLSLRHAGKQRVLGRHSHHSSSFKPRHGLSQNALYQNCVALTAVTNSVTSSVTSSFYNLCSVRVRQSNPSHRCSAPLGLFFQVLLIMTSS